MGHPGRHRDQQAHRSVDSKGCACEVLDGNKDPSGIGLGVIPVVILKENFGYIISMPCDFKRRQV